MRRTPALGRRAALVGAAALAGCQAPPAPVAEPSLGTDRTGYVILLAPISRRTRELFIADMDRLLTLKPAALTVFLASPGGTLVDAQAMAAYVTQVQANGVPVTMHNLGLVASAACYLFLAGQRRLSVPQGQFLFHQAALVSSGPVSITSQQLQELSLGAQAMELALIQTLVSRTRLTEAEAQTFVRRTVVLSADEARRDGVTDQTAPATPPPGSTGFAIRYAPDPAAAPATPPAAPTP